MNLVSIIIPTYNNANTICRTVDSCINQTYKNIEIIVIDDGSTDDTKEILSKYNSNERFKYIYQENQERSAARNNGLDLARGEYIQFLDSDDEIYPTKIEKQVDFLNANPEYFLVYCGVEYKNELGQRIHTLEPKIDGNIDYEILKGNFITIHSPLFRKTDVRFDTKINRYEDWKFWIFSTRGMLISYIDILLCNVLVNKQEKKDYVIGMLKGKTQIYLELTKNINFRQYKFTLQILKFKTILHTFYHEIDNKIRK
jgi:glycosyltransferase involved in cell wall biosynthesis